MQPQRSTKFVWLLLVLLLGATVFALSPTSTPAAAQEATPEATPETPATPPPPQGAAYLELIGIVTAFDATTLTINGQVIDISSADIDLQLAVGVLVEVHAWLLADGSIVAYEVDPFDDDDLAPGEIELIGIVTALDGNTLTLGGLTIDISTAVIDDDDTPLRVGVLVEIYAVVFPDGRLVARLVTTEDAANDDDDDDDNDDRSRFARGVIVIIGTLDDFDDGSIIIGGQVIIIEVELDLPRVIGARYVIEIRVENANWVVIAMRFYLPDDDRRDDDDDDDDNRWRDDDDDDDNGSGSNPPPPGSGGDDDDDHDNGSGSNPPPPGGGGSGDDDDDGGDDDDDGDEAGGDDDD